jgi:tetraacyldisaccharide 4'-kinase
VIVVADPDRVRGVAHARGLGATAVVLDDAFQHRRARRGADIVLVSVDQWTGDARMLPAGPFREPLHALRRATVVVLTRKAASEQQAEALGAELRGHAPTLRTAVACLAPAELRRWGGPETAGLEAIAGQTVLAVSAIGDPAAFEAQLAGLGAQVVARRFRDHHAFTAADATALARDAETTSARLVCTLKDAVKLGPVWPRAHDPLWYVSQRVTVERGAHELGRAIRAALRAQRS